MITETITKRDPVSFKMVTRNYPIRVMPLYEDDIIADPVLMNKLITRTDNYDGIVTSDKYYIPKYHNEDKVVAFIRNTFFCDTTPERIKGGQQYALYFIELKKYALLEPKETIALISVGLFCDRVKIFAYMKEYFAGVDIVGDNGLIRVVMPTRIIKDSTHPVIEKSLNFV